MSQSDGPLINWDLRQCRAQARNGQQCRLMVGHHDLHEARLPGGELVRWSNEDQRPT